MQVGDLVTYKRKRKDNRFSYEIGVVVGKCPVKNFGHYILIQWGSGARFSEHRKFLQLVKN